MLIKEQLAVFLRLGEVKAIRLTVTKLSDYNKELQSIVFVSIISVFSNTR